MYSILILLKLIYYQFKIRCYKITFYVSLMVTTRESLVLITQKNMVKKSKHTETKDVKTHI